jgi:phosphohistidine phosphatase
MDIYLMQHGEAVPAEVDPERPLADAGRASVAAVAAHAAARGVTVDRIVHSGKLRAVQTAAILAEAVGCTALDRADGLKPGDDVRAAAAALVDPGQAGSLAIVGHLPSLDRLASLLVAGDPEAHVVKFRNGGLVSLVPSAAVGRFSVAWAITPEVARD